MILGLCVPSEHQMKRRLYPLQKKLLRYQTHESQGKEQADDNDHPLKSMRNARKNLKPTHFVEQNSEYTPAINPRKVNTRCSLFSIQMNRRKHFLAAKMDDWQLIISNIVNYRPCYLTRSLLRYILYQPLPTVPKL